jgi:methyl-accepting chemotaxis protein
MVVKYATDVTAQVLASQALQLAVQQTHAVVSAAEENDLTQRIALEDKLARSPICAAALPASLTP